MYSARTSGDGQVPQLGNQVVAWDTVTKSISDRPAELLLARKYSVKQAATAMGVGMTSLRRLIRDGKIPVLNIGSKILLLEKDIERFLEGHHVTLQAQKVRTPRASLLPQEVVNSPHLV